MSEENPKLDSPDHSPLSRTFERDGRKMGGFGRQMGRRSRIFGGQKRAPISPAIMAGFIALILIGFASVGLKFLW